LSADQRNWLANQIEDQPVLVGLTTQISQPAYAAVIEVHLTLTR